MNNYNIIIPYNWINIINICQNQELFWFIKQEIYMLIKLKQKPKKKPKYHSKMKALSQLKKNPPADFETQSKAETIKL